MGSEMCIRDRASKGTNTVLLAELHGDVFSRHASHLENYVFVGVDERGEDIVSDEICRRNYRKQKRRRGGRSETL